MKVKKRDREACRLVVEWHEENDSPAAQSRLVAHRWRLWRLARDMARELQRMLDERYPG